MPQKPIVTNPEKGLKELDQFTAYLEVLANDAYFTDIHAILTESYDPSQGDLLCQLSIIIERMKVSANKFRNQ